MPSNAPARPEADPPMGIRIYELHHAVYQAINRRFQAAGLTMPQTRVLGYLEEHEGEAVNQRAIQDLLHIRNPSVTSLIHNLVEKGWVERLPDEADGRCHLLRLTEAGRLAHQGVADTFCEVDRQLEEGFTFDERRKLAEAMERMRKNIER